MMDHKNVKCQEANEWLVHVKQEPPSCSLSDERCSSDEASYVDGAESELAEVLDEHDRLEADLAYQCCLAEDRFGQGQSFNSCAGEISDSQAANLTLWQFLLELLVNGKRSDIIHWTNADGEFQLLKAEEVAQLWGMRKNKNHRMNYDKLSRALRYYYQKNIIRKVHGQKFVYKFIGLNKLALDACKSALEREQTNTTTTTTSTTTTTTTSTTSVSDEGASFDTTNITASLNYTPIKDDNTLMTNTGSSAVTPESKKNLMASSVESTTCSCTCHCNSKVTLKLHRSTSVSTTPPIKKRAMSPETMMSGASAGASTTPWPLDLSCTAPSLFVDSYTQHQHQHHQQTTQHHRHSANMSRLAQQLHLQQHNAMTSSSVAAATGYIPSSNYFSSCASSSILNNNNFAHVDTKGLEFDTLSYHAALAAADSAVCVWMPIPIHLINRVWKTFLDPTTLSSSTSSMSLPTSTSPFSTTN